MKKRLSLLLLTVLFGFAANAQQTIQSDKMDAYNAIEITGNVTVEMTKASDKSSIEIKLNNTTIDKLDWGVKNGTLFVRLKPNVGNSGANAEVKLAYNPFNRLKVSGANVAVQDTVKSLMLDVDVSAGGTLGLNYLDVADLLINVNGNSVANIGGTVKYYTLNATSRSKVDSRSLNCVDANVSASSGAEVYVRANERMQLSSDTGASLFYAGEPTILRTSTKTMGVVNFIGK